MHWFLQALALIPAWRQSAGFDWVRLVRTRSDRLNGGAPSYRLWCSAQIEARRAPCFNRREYSMSRSGSGGPCQVVTLVHARTNKSLASSESGDGFQASQLHEFG